MNLVRVFPILLLTLITATAHATPSEDPFARYEVLARAFPEAFRRYVNREYLIPMAPPAWSESSPGDYNLILFPRLTESGRRTMASALPEISLDLGTSGGEYVFSVDHFSSWIPPEYGWRVVIAELLLKFPYVDAVGVGSIASISDPDLGPCAERLAKGLDLLTIAKNLPVARAARDFGFEVTSAEVGDVDAPKYPRSYLGQLHYNLNMERSAKILETRD